MTAFDLKKYRRIADEIEHEKEAPFTLYALLMRDDALGAWDIVMAASWIEGGTRQEIQYVVDKLTEHLTPSERLHIAQILLLRSDDRLVFEILDASQPVAHDAGVILSSIRHAHINGVLIERGCVLATNQYLNAVAAAIARRR